MIRDALSNIGGIGIYGVVSITLFFAAFLGVLIWSFRLKKPWLQSMSRLPLEGDDEENPGAVNTPEPPYRHEPTR